MTHPGSHSAPQEPSRSGEAPCRTPVGHIPQVKEIPANLDKVKVLIADDQQIACEVLRRLLRYEKNVEVIGTCSTGPETLEAIKQLNPDLVFLDVQMPGLNGFEVVERLPKNRNPMVIFVTANPGFESKAARVRADFLLKPCTRDRIQNALRRALDKRKPTAKGLNF